MTQQLAMFDYETLDTETRIVVQQKTSEIKSLMKRAAQDIIDIGQKLIEVKERLGHGRFLKWLESEFDLTERTARRFMRVAEKFKTDTVSVLPTTKILYLLSEENTPEIAVQEILELAAQGERITYNAAKELVSQYKSTLVPEPEDTDPLNETVEIQTFDQWVNESSNEFEETEEVEPIRYTEHVLNTATVQTVTEPNPQAKQSQPMQLLASSQNDSWRTPAVYLEAARRVMGSIDLDPASSEDANDVVQATYIHTKNTDGLAHTWHGNIWLNPPYGKTNGKSNQGLFAAKLANEYEQGNVKQGILLVNLYTGYEWFKPLFNRAWCIADHRISFVNPDTGEIGDEAKASSVFVYFGKNPQRFFQIFSQFGYCCQPIKY